MVQIMRKLIEAERLGNWNLHLQAVSEKATIIGRVSSRVSVHFMSQWSSPCSVHRCCAWQYSYPALPNFVSNSSDPRKASACFHTFQDSIIRSVDKPVQARILLLATSIPYSKCWYTAGWALCKLRMAFKQILADLTQETANYGSFSVTTWRRRYQLPSRSASINLRIICTMLMYCVHKLVKPFHKLTT